MEYDEQVVDYASTQADYEQEQAEELVSSVDFTEDNNTPQEAARVTQNILHFFKENDHYIEWRKENILNQFTNQILNENDYFDTVQIAALPIDEEIQNFVSAALSENDTARKGMEQLTDEASRAKSEVLRLQAQLKETTSRLNDCIEMNKQLVKEKWWQKLFRNVNDYKYKYELTGAQEKK